MEGAFAIGDAAMPVLDLRYARLLGDRTPETRVVSTGEVAFVVADGKTVEVPPEEAARLRLGGGDGGIADLGIAGWAREPGVEERDGGVRVLRGTVDVADLLSRRRWRRRAGVRRSAWVCSLGPGPHRRAGGRWRTWRGAGRRSGRTTPAPGRVERAGRRARHRRPPPLAARRRRLRRPGPRRPPGGAGRLRVTPARARPVARAPRRAPGGRGPRGLSPLSRSR